MISDYFIFICVAIFYSLYYLFIDDSVDVTSEPDDQDVSVAAAASHNPNKGQLEVQLGGAVTLQCPQGEFNTFPNEFSFL